MMRDFAVCADLLVAALAGDWAERAAMLAAVVAALMRLFFPDGV